jgi:hypothetical protein
VPPLYLVLVLWLQPTDRLGDSQKAPWLHRLLYDDYDAAAYALRGLNAALERTPGRPDDPEPLSPQEFCQELDRPERAGERDLSYFLEYPHAALLLFRLGYPFGDRLKHLHFPPAVYNGRYHNLVAHEPRNEAERVLWRALRDALRFYSVLGIACLLVLMFVLGAGYEPSGRRPGALGLLILPGALYFSLSRFDIIPALLCALALACLGRRWTIASALFLGIATTVKMYPVLLAPLFARYLSSDRKSTVEWIAAYGIVGLAILLPPLILTGWDATWAPYRYQLSRFANEGGSFYGYVWPVVLTSDPVTSGLFRNGSVLLVLLALVWNRPESMVDLCRRAAIVLIVFVGLQVFYSPQWILWLTPFLVPLADRNRAVWRLSIALDMLTFLSFPIVFDLAIDWLEPACRTMLIFARFAVLVGLVAAVWRGEFGADAWNSRFHSASAAG